MTTPQRKYQVEHQEKGLCPACANKVAVKLIKQDDKIVFEKKMLFCWTHHQSRVIYQRKKDRAKKNK